MKMRNRIILVVGLVVLSLIKVNAKGISGEYQMKGVIYDKTTKLPLSNTSIVVNGKSIMTDIDGKYEVTILWATCDQGRFFRIWICNKKRNNKIEIKKDNNSSIYIRSRWRKYGLRTHQDFGEKDENEKKEYLKNIYI